MNKDGKIIIIGFGSIGQRHYNNLLGLGHKNVFVYDPDTKRTKCLKPGFKQEIISVEALKQFDIAFICTPNNLHIKNALDCSQAGLHLFIEKPLSHNSAGIKDLISICQEKKLINMVACNMRFHPCLRFIKGYLTEKKLGKVYSIHHECGSYLPHWRPNTDYRQNYAARKSTGGGIILDDIHEFDLLFWLNNFEEAMESKFVYAKTSDLEIETEDNSIAVFKFSNKVLGSVRSDYLQQAYSRNCKIVGEKGNLEWDFNENIVWLKNKEHSRKLFEIKNYDLNQMYVEQIKYFFNCLDRGQSTFNDISTALIVLKPCLKK